MYLWPNNSFKLQASILIDFVDVLCILVVYISYDTYGQLGFAHVITYTCHAYIIIVPYRQWD